MSKKLFVEKSVTIKAPPSKVWQALTDPDLIRQYLFGTHARSDWKKGSPIIYTGEWQGKRYEDKGKIIDIIPEELLHTTYFSSMSGKEDIPDNYANVIYKLEAQDIYTKIIIQQDNIEDESGVAHMKENWGKVLDGMKRLLES